MIVALSDIVLLRDLSRPLSNLIDAPTLCNYLECFYTLRKGASGIIFPIIKSEGVRQMYFPAMVASGGTRTLTQGYHKNKFFAVQAYNIKKMTINK
ncbi:putative squalene monooxygenase [Helianthus anomalus]